MKQEIQGRASTSNHEQAKCPPAPQPTVLPEKRSEKKSPEKRHHNSVSFLLHKSLFSKAPCDVGDKNPGFGKRAGSPACGGGVQERQPCAKRKIFFDAHWKKNFLFHVEVVSGKHTRQGLLRELNPGPLAPEARIMPLDQAASWKRAALSSHQFLLLWFRSCFQIGC